MDAAGPQQPPREGERLEDFVRAGLVRLGIRADEAELAVMAAVDAIYKPQLAALVEADLSAVEPEPELFVGRPPR